VLYIHIYIFIFVRTELVSVLDQQNIPRVAPESLGAGHTQIYPAQRSDLFDVVAGVLDDERYVPSVLYLYHTALNNADIQGAPPPYAPYISHHFPKASCSYNTST
jgi:hypothetical protein